MPQPAKGIRLWLRPGSARERPSWVIRDGEKHVRTGCAPGELVEAEKALAAYIAERHRPTGGSRDPEKILIADVLNLYAAEVAPKHARPYETASRLARLAEFWGDRTLAGVNGSSCRSYCSGRGSSAAARRELEDLRAAIIHHRREGHCSAVVEVTLPEKSAPRERWLTRAEAARLLWAAWRGGQGKRKHVARFILVGLYTGTRAAAICGASLTPAVGRGHVDLDRGVFYRRGSGVKETNKRQPPVRLPSRLLAHIARWRRSGASTVAVVEYQGRPVLRVSKAFRQAAKEAGLVGVSPHTLRHTAITWACMSRDVGLFDVAGYFGVSPQVIEKTYWHVNPSAGRNIHKALERK